MNHVFVPGDPRLQFAPVPLGRDEWISAVESRVGWKYNHRVTVTDGAGRGETDCVRLFLLAARDKGLLPSDFPLETAKPAGRGRADRALFTQRWLEQNFDPIPLSSRCPGDLLYLRTDEADAPPLHVALLSYPDESGSECMFHLWPVGSEEAGREYFFSDWWGRVDSVWALKNFEVGE